jgi:hypothetical protein
MKLEGGASRVLKTLGRKRGRESFSGSNELIIA